MAFREFTDETGAEWSVYEITPRNDDRRAADRRHGESATTEDERRSQDRRLAVRSSRPVRLTKGWLCFERDGERRRLQPVPTDWQHLPDAELVKLLALATAARRPTKNENAGASRR